MLGATMYLAGVELPTGVLIAEANSCSMCKRMIINAGISTVIVRTSPDDYKIIDVNDWIENDDSLEGKFGY